MAPRQSRKSEPVLVHGSESESESREESMQEDEIDPVKTAQNMMNKFRDTLEIRRKAIEDEHKKQVKDAAAKIETLFEARKKKVTKSRKDVFTRLVAMNKKRQALEHQIVSSMRAIEIHSTNMANELEAMFVGRIEEMEEPVAKSS